MIGYERDTITILIANEQTKTADTLIGAPVQGMVQQGLIQMWSVASGQQGKYILHTLAQRALVELEDKTIETFHYPAGTILEAIYNDMKLSFSEGVLLAMDASNRIQVFTQEGVKVAAILREFHRYATRMIRLDVR